MRKILLKCNKENIHFLKILLLLFSIKKDESVCASESDEWRNLYVNFFIPHPKEYLQKITLLRMEYKALSVSECFLPISFKEHTRQEKSYYITINYLI